MREIPARLKSESGRPAIIPVRAGVYRKPPRSPELEQLKDQIRAVPPRGPCDEHGAGSCLRDEEPDRSNGCPQCLWADDPMVPKAEHVDLAKLSNWRGSDDRDRHDPGSDNRSHDGIGRRES